MKFSSAAVLAVVAPLAAGFATTANQRQFVPKNVAFVPPSAARRSTTSRGAMSMDLSDLEKRLLEPKEEKKVTKAKPEPKKVAPKPKPEPKKPEPKKPKAKKVEPAPAPTPAPEPVKGKKASTKYDLGGVEGTPKAKKEKPAPAPKVVKPKAEKPKITPPPKKEKPVPKPAAPKTPAVKDPNAVPAGVALGAAPLILAPVALLGAGRSILTGTKARREKIQKEIATFEAAKAKKTVSAEVDAGGVVTALVGSLEMVVISCMLLSFLYLTLCSSFFRDFWELQLQPWP